MITTTQPAPNRNLKSNCLSYSEVIAQSISVIAPSTVPAAVLGLIFASAGNGTWLSFLLCMLGLLCVGVNINQFARRSASPGSLYTYIVRGLGPTAGALSGWGLVLAYSLTGMSTLCGFAIFAQVLLTDLGIESAIVPLFAFGTILAWYVAFRDIQLSAKTMLLFEGVSLLLILVLGAVVWAHTGFLVDFAQFKLEGASSGGMLSAIVLVAFGFSGFESSTSLGDEARNPLRTIPRSIIQSTLISGTFFIFMSYVIILGFRDSGANLAETEAPLDFLAPRVGLGFMGTVINIGVLLSFFACTLACINSTARLVFSMARHGLFHDAFGEAHEKNETPHIAIGLSALVTFLVPLALYLSGLGVFPAQGFFGALSSFGFLFAYILVSIAAPIYLRDVGKLRRVDLLPAALAVGFMILPVVGAIGIPGSTVFPQQKFPYSLLPWIFLVYMLIGFMWLLIQRFRSPSLMGSMKGAVDKIELQFSEVKKGP